MYLQLLRLLLLALFELTTGNGGYASYGPALKPTIGEVWPKPLWQDDSGRYYAFDANNFQFKVVNKDCDVLQQAIARYTQIIRQTGAGYVRAPQVPTIGSINVIQVNLRQACGEASYPALNMDESYYVWGNGSIIANTIWGILRGMETFSQLLVPMPNGAMRLPETEIYDVPRYKYRGIMLDTARHFIGKSKILELLAGMSYNKFNVLHWHMTDDSAFPYNSTVYPELSSAGAYSAAHTYAPADVREIVEFARLRGIRVVPEFDTPAHTASWAASHAELMTKCEWGPFAGQLGPFNPTLDSTFTLLSNLFSEIAALFPDQYMHLGMDEVNPSCWEANAQIQSYLKTHKLDNGDIPYLYLERFSALIGALGKQQMVWQEAITNHNAMGWPRGLIAQLWFNYSATASAFTQKSHQIIRSDGWYLYVLETGGDWERFYTIDPADFKGTQKQKQRVLGGEACLWSEYINDNNLMPTTFPRASAVAERLWSEAAIRDVKEARLRLEEHNCRMLLRGVAARPANNYGFC